MMIREFAGTRRRVLAMRDEIPGGIHDDSGLFADALSNLANRALVAEDLTKATIREEDPSVQGGDRSGTSTRLRDRPVVCIASSIGGGPGRTLCDVSTDRDDPLSSFPIDEGANTRFELDTLATSTSHANMNQEIVAGFNDFLKSRQGELAVFWNYDLEKTQTRQGVCTSSDATLDGVTDVDDSAIGTEFEHDVGGVAKQFFCASLSGNRRRR